MSLVVRHGINGKEELVIQVAATAPVGWDIMKQLAWRLALDSPFQIILYLNSTAMLGRCPSNHHSQRAFFRSEAFIFKVLNNPGASPSLL